MKQYFFDIAIKEAKKAYNKGEVPVGAVIVKENKILSKSYNMVERKKDATRHAEIIAIQKAAKKLRNWRLNKCEMYVTLEPCNMCVSAIELSRIEKVYFIVSKDKEILLKKEKYINVNYKKEETLNIIKNFFKNRR